MYEKILTDLEKLRGTDSEWHALCELVGLMHYVGHRHRNRQAHAAWVKRKQARGSGFGPKARRFHALIATLVA